jgi:Uma2 family endonuclease
MGMSVAILPELALSPNRMRWTREQTKKMADCGLIEGRYELIEGELISKMGQNPAHSYVIKQLNRILAQLFDGDRVQIQSPIRIPGPAGDFSEPEPDVVLLRRGGPEFLSRHPEPADIALLIEISDTSLAIDRGAKYQLYSRAGITEYWILDIKKGHAIVCRHPEDGIYRSEEILEASDQLTALDAPGLSLTLDSLLS